MTNMTISVGDLVFCRDTAKKIGLVVDKKHANEKLTESVHVRHIMQHYPHLYYVFFADEGKKGPYYEDDLVLEQAFM